MRHTLITVLGGSYARVPPDQQARSAYLRDGRQEEFYLRDGRQEEFGPRSLEESIEAPDAGAGSSAMWTAKAQERADTWIQKLAGFTGRWAAYRQGRR